MKTGSRFSILLIATLTLLLVLAYSARPTRTATSAAYGQAAFGEYLPIIIHHIPPSPTPTPTLTPTPELSNVYLINETGGNLCYEVVNSGIGRKCSSEANFFYGSFTPGTYTWKATARCGRASDTEYFGPGNISHRFRCLSALQSQR